MKPLIFTPDISQLQAFLNSKLPLLPSYTEKGDTKKNFAEQEKFKLSKKYDYDDNRILLGEGEVAFEKAKEAIRNWKMFPEKWTKIFPLNTPIEVGRKVVVLFRILGLWWLNSSEIIYCISESHRFGFAYGTLPGHVESGEELFLVEMDASGKVWYRIKAFSRPAYWIISLGYPYARRQQKRFVSESMQQMRAFVNEKQLLKHE